MRVIDLLYKIANQEYIPIYIEYNSNGKRNVMMVCEENIIDKLDKGELYLNSNVSEYNPYENEEKAKDLQDRIDKAIEWINSHIETYTKNRISIIDWDNFSDPRKLLDILRGDE